MTEKLNGFGKNIFIVFLLNLIFFTHKGEALWKHTLIENTEGGGGDTSISLDKQNKIHIIHILGSLVFEGNGLMYSSLNSSLGYVNNISGEWVSTKIELEGGSISQSSHYLDKNGRIHISCVEGGDLKYITNISGSFIAERVDSIGHLKIGSAIVADGKNTVYIVYSGRSTGLKIAIRSPVSGKWEIKNIDAYAGQLPDVSLDKNNKIHIVYEGPDFARGLKYATDKSGVWEITLLDDWARVNSPAITLDGNDQIHIAYNDYFLGILKYVTFVGESWVKTVIDKQDISSVSIITDRENKVHISYALSGLKYATNASGEWKNHKLDISSGAGDYSSILVDSVNQIHISYGAGKRGLKYVFGNASE